METTPIETKVTEEDWPFGRNFLLDYSLKDKINIWFKNLIIIIPVPTEVTPQMIIKNYHIMLKKNWKKKKRVCR